MESTTSSNIDLNYKFPYKFNFVSSIVDGKFILNIIGDSQNKNFISICHEIESQIINVLEENVELNHSIIETDFSTEQLVDKQTISHFINKLNDIEEIYPVTPLQEGMLFHSEVKQSTEYISQLSFDLKGNIPLKRLEEAWNDTCQSYDVLRSVFKRNHVGDRYQIILSNIYYTLEEIDLTDYSGVELEEIIGEILVKSKEKEIDIENGPLMNIILIKLSNNHYKFVWTHHHVLIDGWSLQIIINHFMNRYQNNMEALENGEKQKRAYKQFLKQMKNVNQQDEAVFWKNELSNFKHGHTLFNKQKGKQHGEIDKVIEYSLSEYESKKLLEISKQYRITINTVVQGIWGLALSHFSGSEEICYGVTSSGRNNSIQNIESTVGLLINTQPFLIKIDTEADLLSYFSSIQDQQLKMREYEFSSLTDIKRYANIPWNKELFEQIFVFENYPSKGGYDSEISIENSQGEESTNFDLTFSAAMIESKLHYKIIYKDGIYEKNDIIRFMDAMEIMLTDLTKETQTIGDIINNLKVGI